MRPETTGNAASKRGRRPELVILGALVAIVVAGIVLTLNSGSISGWRSALP
jgi:hypothetical protein